MVSRILCFCLVIVVANAATWMGRLPMKPKELAQKRGCYIEQINDVIPFGSAVAPLGVCERIECTEERLYYSSCGVVGTDDPKCYKTKTDYSKPYPLCCPTLECEFDNNLI